MHLNFRCPANMPSIHSWISATDINSGVWTCHLYTVYHFWMKTVHYPERLWKALSTKSWRITSTKTSDLIVKQYRVWTREQDNFLWDAPDSWCFVFQLCLRAAVLVDDVFLPEPMILPEQVHLLYWDLLRLRQEEEDEAAHYQDQPRKQQEDPVL